MRCTLAALCLLVVACKPEPTPTTEPTTEPVADGTADGGAADGGNKCAFEGPPTNGDQCECAGGTVRGDIGDGKVACEEGETELARIQSGVEGGVCCKAAAMPP
jgi:hypothetical protein